MDVIFRETVADSSGNFNFCPLPAGATFDVVAVAIDGNGAGYNATIAANVPGGTNIGFIPLNIETGASNKPTIFQGVITASGSASIDAAVSALQTVPFSGIEPRAVTIPAEGNSVSNVSVVSSTLCPAGAACKSELRDVYVGRAGQQSSFRSVYRGCHNVLYARSRRRTVHDPRRYFHRAERRHAVVFAFIENDQRRHEQ